MKITYIRKAHSWKLWIVLLTGVIFFGAVNFSGHTQAVSEAQAQVAAQATLKQYCAQCHSGTAAKAGINLTGLMEKASVGESFQQWEKVVDALEHSTMPPKAMPQPSDAERAQAANWIRTSLREYAKKHDGDPGLVTVRRLTSGEYAYAIKDLTGVELNTGIDSSNDTVGGEGFTNFGDVQFMQDANLERYLAAAKTVAEHAVIGSGPIEFFNQPGKTGFEMSAVNRIKDIYATYGFRTVSGEGGRPFGLEKYSKALYAAWRFKHRATLGESNITLKQIADKEGITLRFAQHVWKVMNTASLGYPTSEMVARWQKLPAPASNEAAVRKECEELQKFIVTWPSWLFARGDVAAGGAGDESPLEFSDRTLNVKNVHRFAYVRGAGRGPVQPGPAKIYLNVLPVNPATPGKPTVIWRNLTIGFRPIQQRAQLKAGESAVVLAADAEAAANLRRGILPPGERFTLRSMVNAETAASLNFGKAPDGSTLGQNDFVSEGSTMFEIPMPEGATMIMNMQVDAEISGNRDQVIRIVISDRADGATRGQPTRALIGDMNSAGYKAFRAGVLEYATLLPPNSNSEPTPADKDPVPDPFDNTYNVPEHDEFVVKVKYIRDDKFFAENLIDAPTRKRLDQAWNDLYSSFEYHNNYLRLLGKHYGLDPKDLKDKDIAQMDKAQIALLPVEMRKYVIELRAHYDKVAAAELAGRASHLNDCLDFASQAWRRPLTEAEKLSLRSFYSKTLAAESDHRKAIRTLIARILVAPQFLYKVEESGVGSRETGVGRREIGDGSRVTDMLQTSSKALFASSPTPDSQLPSPSVKPLTNWEMASRLSFFLWASIPDAELRRAAAAGELTDNAGIERQVKRMLADAKARRMATEFFGQWLGFYHFDQSKGVDTSRFPEFTDDVKEAMYDEAVSFFEHIIRRERPLDEMLNADYTFLNKDLAKFYGVTKDIKSTDSVELVQGASAFHRGGLLRLGAVLTATSAPLRTSPVKRGDWILRRILGTPVPPPPADAGSLPADDKLFGGLSLKAKLEQHKRNATCANCHLRIDPLGFSLEHFDSTGRWRDKYLDGKIIEDSAALPDKTEVAGVEGLLQYLKSKDNLVRKTLAFKLTGFALGRTVTAADQSLIERMVAKGGKATFAQLASEVATSKQFRNRMVNDEQSLPAKNSANTAMR